MSVDGSLRVRLPLAFGLGCLGFLPGAAGAWDARTELGWLALVAPALGAWLACDASVRWRLLLVPLAWSLLWVFCAGPAAAPWPPCLVTGFFAAGVSLGRRAGPAGVPWALGLPLVLAGLPLGFGWLPGGAALAPTQPRLVAAALDLSPLVLAFDCAGFDWLHAQPEVYARAGVEWFPRRPFEPRLAGAAVLVVGCLLAGLVPAVRPTRQA